MRYNETIYLDYNSTTPIDPKVLETMLPFLMDNFANSSSSHPFGQSINEKVKQAREQIADFINCEPNELIFTSGATEAINLAIKGVSESYCLYGNHIITVSTEHHAVLDTCKELEKKGFDVTYLKVNSKGLIDFNELANNLRKDTILVSVMYVNNETGVIQNLKDISRLVKSTNAVFMTDATQAVGKIDVNVDDLGVDLLCFSGHKMYAPKGIGTLYVRKNVRLTPQIHGGGHERGLRSGTLNVPGIIALAKACEISREEMLINQVKISELRDRLESGLLKLPNTSVNGDPSNRIFNTTNICFKGQEANVLIGRMKNIAASNGSACSSAIVEPSHVLKAMKLTDDDAFASIRFSLGKHNTIDDTDMVISKLKELIQPNF